MGIEEEKRIGRNQSCPCNSGKRYKDCCGSLRNSDEARFMALMEAALRAQKANDLKRAEEKYLEALGIIPSHPDALHMLGVIFYERKKYREAYDLMLQALDLTKWHSPILRNNFGLVLFHLAKTSPRFYEKKQNTENLKKEYLTWQARRPETFYKPHEPTVTVIIPCFNHRNYLSETITSVFDQSYRKIEIVFIDDGSSDGSFEEAKRLLKNSPFPFRLIARENRGAAATINEGIALSSSPFVNILNSDDSFPKERLQVMVQEVCGQAAEWGFSEVDCIDQDGRKIDPLFNSRVFSILCAAYASAMNVTTGMAFVKDNIAVSTGNLFFSRHLFKKIGGFKDYRYVHDWDFCLKALKFSEPVFVRKRLYKYRLHENNTINESREKSKREAEIIFKDFLASAVGESGQSESIFYPSLGCWEGQFILEMVSAGMLGFLPREESQRIFSRIVKDYL